jgi:hypothetical protein
MIDNALCSRDPLVKPLPMKVFVPTQSVSPAAPRLPVTAVSVQFSTNVPTGPLNEGWLYYVMFCSILKSKVSET